MGQAVTLFVRPNNVELLDVGAEAGENVFPASISKLTYLGDTIDCRVVLPNGQELRVQTDGQRCFDSGAEVQVRFPPDRCHLIAENG